MEAAREAAKEVVKVEEVRVVGLEEEKVAVLGEEVEEVEEEVVEAVVMVAGASRLKDQSVVHKNPEG